MIHQLVRISVVLSNFFIFMIIIQCMSFFILTILVDYQVNDSQIINFHKCNNSWLSPIVLTNWLLNLFYENNEMCNVHSRYFSI
jgi:hypothetical protein